MSRRSLTCLIALALAGCGDDTTTPGPDLTARPGADLAVVGSPDLLVAGGDAASSPDLVSGSCGDGVRNGAETDVDCGGACPACPVGRSCGGAADCSTGVCQMGVCGAASCTDGIRNGGETDVDCGGACGPCADGKTCVVAADCRTGVCTGGTCQAGGCSDGVKNAMETDVDCGGACPVCVDGKGCAVDADCQSKLCKAGLCSPAGCGDGKKNGMETDVDCGATCPPCGDGAGCASGGDCLSQVCAAGKCAAPACTDGKKNGKETDVDCGGGCKACAEGQGCAVGADCAAGVCKAGKCAAAACDDKAKNGKETDVDCGGGACPACPDKGACLAASDCLSGVCVGGKCAAPACDDKVKNGKETDLDCGGGCPGCADGKPCLVGGDCASSVCVGGKCAAPACDDKVKNGKETDLDCGGGCPGCADGAACGAGSDCASGVCKSGVCVSGSCSDGVKNGDETDTDCGGSCAPCADGLACAKDADCASKVCAMGKCAVPSCSDGVKNGKETGVDCGGACPACPTTITWSDTATAYRGKNGTQYRFVCPANGTLGGVWGTDTYTDDSSLCTAAVHSGIITREKGGAITVEIRGGQAAYVSSKHFGITSTAYGAWVGSFVFVPYASPNCGSLGKDGTETDVDCGGDCQGCADFKGCKAASDCQTAVCYNGECAGAATWSTNVTAFRGKTGKALQFVCPPNGSASSIWGTDTYTDDSSVCTAAVHAGRITLLKGGVITVEIRAGQSAYVASQRNGITSSSYGAWSGSFAFLSPPVSNCGNLAKDGDETDVDCGGSCPACFDTRVCKLDGDCRSKVCKNGLCAIAANWSSNATSLRGNNGKQYAFICPSSGARGSIWGTDVYTDDSSVCTAAVHVGKIDLAKGGTVSIEIRAGQGSYTASTRNGVTSNAYGAWSGSFAIP